MRIMNIDNIISQQIYTIMGNDTLSDKEKTFEMAIIEKDISKAHANGTTTHKPIMLLTVDDLFDVEELKRLCFPEDIGCEPVELIW